MDAMPAATRARSCTRNCDKPDGAPAGLSELQHDANAQVVAGLEAHQFRRDGAGQELLCATIGARVQAPGDASVLQAGPPVQRQRIAASSCSRRSWLPL